MSMILDYGRTRHPDTFWTVGTWPPFKELIEKAKEVDDLIGEPDCEDQEKVDWFERIDKKIQDEETKLERLRQYKELAKEFGPLSSDTVDV
jgi:hypothetical protein